jgi:hypothetical protein
VKSFRQISFPPAALWALVMTVYVAATLFATLHHEPWRDEADSWLLVRDNDLSEVFARMPYAGTPGLWYLLLYPLPRLGLPFLAQGILHLVLASLAAGLFLWRAPLPRITRVLFVFSFFMAYEYAVVSRTYVLTVLLLFCAGALHRMRFATPVLYAVPVALLFNTNAHSVVIAGAVVLAYAIDVVRDRRWSVSTVAALAVMVSGGGAAVWQLRPPPDPNITGGLIRTTNYALGGWGIGQAFLPLLDLTVAAIVAGVLVVALVLTLSREPMPWLVFAISFGWLAYVFVFKYFGGVRHFGLFLIVTMYVLWIRADHTWSKLPPRSQRPVARLAAYAPPMALVLLNVCLAYSVYVAMNQMYFEWRYAFSGAKDMATYVAEAGLAGRPIVAHGPAHAGALLPHLPGVQIWYLGLDRFGTNMPWDDAYRRAEELTHEEAIDRIPAELGARPDLLVLLNGPLPARFEGKFRLLYKSVEPVFRYPEETYYLYEYKS